MLYVGKNATHGRSVWPPGYEGFTTRARGMARGAQEAAIMKRKGSTTSIVIATVAGLAVLGVAGYRMVSGDCSSCAISGLITGGSATTVAAPIAAEGDACCALKAGCETEATAVTTVATEGEACGAGACDKAVESCSAAAAACETACSGEAVQTVATEAEACGSTCSDKPACGSEEAPVELVKAPQ